METLVEDNIAAILTKAYEQENGEKLNLTSYDIEHLNEYLKRFSKQIKDNKNDIINNHRNDRPDLKDNILLYSVVGFVVGAVAGIVKSGFENGTHTNEYLNRPEIADKINEIYNNTGASSIEELKYFFTNDIFTNQHIQDSFTFSEIIQGASNFALHEGVTSLCVFAIAGAFIVGMYPTSKFIMKKIKQKKEEHEVSKKEQVRNEIEEVIKSAKSGIVSKEMQDLKNARDYEKKTVPGKIAFILKEGVSKIKSVKSERGRQL